MMTSSDSTNNPSDYRHRVWCQAPRIVSTEHDGETTVLNEERGVYHTLNEVGTRVWGLLAQGATVDTIVQAIRDEYAIPESIATEQVAVDVVELLRTLHHVGVISSSPIP
jgi:hypothetical protein